MNMVRNVSKNRWKYCCFKKKTLPNNLKFNFKTLLPRTSCPAGGNRVRLRISLSFLGCPTATYFYLEWEGKGSPPTSLIGQSV